MSTIKGNFVFFWGKEDVFSNFYYAPFKHQGILFKWSEQAVMWRKAKLFGADKIADQILKAQTANECKQLGRSREIPFDEVIWVANREDIYTDVLLSKFSNPKLQKVLLDTGEKVLVEASPYDTIWGIGLGVNHPDVINPFKWRGANLLGEILMRVREEFDIDKNKK